MHLCTVLSAPNPRLEAKVGNRRNLQNLSQALLVRREFKHNSEILLLKAWGTECSGIFRVTPVSRVDLWH